MTFNQLINKIATMSNRDWILYPSGVNGYFHLGEQGKIDFHLIGVDAQKILAFVESNP